MEQPSSNLESPRRPDKKNPERLLAQNDSSEQLLKTAEKERRERAVLDEQNEKLNMLGKKFFTIFDNPRVLLELPSAGASKRFDDYNITSSVKHFDNYTARYFDIAKNGSVLSVTINYTDRGIANGTYEISLKFGPAVNQSEMINLGLFRFDPFAKEFRPTADGGDVDRLIAALQKFIGIFEKIATEVDAAAKRKEEAVKTQEEKRKDADRKKLEEF